MDGYAVLLFSRAPEGFQQFPALFQQLFIMTMSHNCPAAFAEPIMVTSLIIGFPRGQPPECSWGNPCNIWGIVHFLNKNFPMVRGINALFGFWNESARSILDVWHWSAVFTFKIPDRGADDIPCCHLYDILWRSFIACYMFVLHNAVVQSTGEKKICNCRQFRRNWHEIGMNFVPQGVPGVNPRESRWQVHIMSVVK